MILVRMVEPLLVTGGSTIPRSLTVRKPLSVEISQLHKLLEDTLLSWQRRRAEAILLYASGLIPVEIAQMPGVHTNTIYADLCAFKQDSLVSYDALVQSVLLQALARLR